ncbi:MAG TPA: hypothetical protein VIW24_16290 [Aldersonia sp.]
MTPDVMVARQVADAALAVDGVRDLHGGMFGEVATYAPGTKIAGVRIEGDRGEVHLVTDLTRNLRTVAEEVRGEAERITGLPFVVTVEDVRIDDPHREAR